MPDPFEFLSFIGEWLASWRLYLSFAIAAGLVFLVFMLVPNEVVRWIICTPIVLLGVFGGFYWEAKTDKL